MSALFARTTSGIIPCEWLLKREAVNAHRRRTNQGNFSEPFSSFALHSPKDQASERRDARTDAGCNAVCKRDVDRSDRLHDRMSSKLVLYPSGKRNTEAIFSRAKRSGGSNSGCDTCSVGQAALSSAA
jgi:hypothetical protein